MRTTLTMATGLTLAALSTGALADNGIGVTISIGWPAHGPVVVAPSHVPVPVPVYRPAPAVIHAPPVYAAPRVVIVQPQPWHRHGHGHGYDHPRHYAPGYVVSQARGWPVVAIGAVGGWR